MSSDLQKFFAQHAVFSSSEFERWRGVARHKRESARQLLAHYCRSGRLLRVRRQLYASVPLSASADSFVVDPLLVAARLTEDAVLAYHTALEFHGRAQSPHSNCYYLSARPSRALRFQSHQFIRVPLPPMRAKRGREKTGILSLERAGMPVQVTSLERTLVDVLDRPELGGSWEEIWRSLESVEYFDPDGVVEYALLLGNATTVAKVGFFLDQHRDRLMVTDQHLRKLRTRRPKRPHYLVRSRRQPGRLVADWNLIVPLDVLERQWLETHEDLR